MARSLTGGPAYKMQLFNTVVTEQAVARTVQVLQSGMLNEGAVTAEFEGALREYLDAPWIAAVNSGTSALHLCLAALEIGPGDEVIVPAQTFIATGLAVLYQGARVVMADVSPRTGNIDPDSVAAKISERTRAVIPVHWGGQPVDLDLLDQVCAPRGVAIIEDAAHAFGASYRGRMIGSISRFTCFSFQAIKGMTTGDGGAVAGLDPRDDETVARRRWFGIDRRAVRRSEIGERSSLVRELGYKYHMNNIAAAIGLGNLAGYPERLARRRAIDAAYRDAFAGQSGLMPLDRSPDRESACWLFGLLVEEREAFARAMKSRGVPVSIIDRRIDVNPVFGGLDDGLEGVAEFDRRHIAVPLHDGLSDDEVDTVIAAVGAGW